MKSKLFFVLCAVAIIVTGCYFTERPLEPEEVETAALTITIGATTPIGRATYSPAFQDPPLDTFETIILEISTTPTPLIVTHNSTEDGPLSGVWTVELPDIPYGTYTITAKAYMAEVDPESTPGGFAAYGNATIELTSTAYEASLILKPVVTDGNGTLRYTLVDPDPYGPVLAELREYNPTEPNPLFPKTLTVNGGTVTETIPAGYYLLAFGDKVPSIVHIYKNLETEVTGPDATNDIFNLSRDPLLDSAVVITLSRIGKVREGTTVAVEVRGPYLPGTLKLNNGADNGILGSETPLTPGAEVYTRTFTMPSKSVVVSAVRIPPEIEVRFEELNKDKHLDFWSADTNGDPIAVISSATPGQKITIRAYEVKGELSSGEITLDNIQWYLNSVLKTGDDNVFTIPSPCTDSYVGAIFDIDNVPHSVAIPIVY